MAKSRSGCSRRLPSWLWLWIARALGIGVRSGERPLVAAALHLATIASGAGMVLSSACYSWSDVWSTHSTTDALDGCVWVLMCSLYVGVGVYAHRLAFRLFVHPKFVEKMRLHSKTVMKLNAALLVLAIMLAMVVAQNALLFNFARPFDLVHDRNLGNKESGLKDKATQKLLLPLNQTTPAINPCQTIHIPVGICQSFFVTQALFSLFFALWNALVAVVLVSVARTHTLDIRRLLCELGFDAELQDHSFRAKFFAPNSQEYHDTLREHMWIDSDRLVSLLRRQDHPPAPEVENQGEVMEEVEQQNEDVNFDNMHLELEDTPTVATFKRLEERTEGDQAKEQMDVRPRIMSTNEILHKYFKLASATRLTSQAFQRWMCCMTLTILFWSSVRLVHWLSFVPSMWGVLAFTLPLLLLPLLASAYAEVNYEGMKVLQSILPTQERLPMFQYLYGLRIEMTAYGHRISYGTMGTILAAVMAAFASRIMLHELNRIVAD